MKIWLYTIIHMLLLHTQLCATVLPTHIKDVLDQHKSELQELLTGWRQDHIHNIVRVKPKEVSWLPGYFIKYGIERYTNAEKLRRFIANNNLDLIDVPHKYVYQVFDNGTEYTNQNSIVVAEKIDGRIGKDQNLTLDQIQQLWRVAVGAPHYDLLCSNYLTTKDGKIYIIDTDAAAMPSLYERLRRTLDWLFYGNVALRHGSVLMAPGDANDPSTRFYVDLCSKHQNFSLQAFSWLATKVAWREKWRTIIRAECITLAAACLLYGGYRKIR